MDAIFHEKQEGSLCAQHCLNALLQGPYFSAVDLADIARQLDETERQHMAAGGLESEAYQEFLKQPSNNYDDSGFFSVQVIAQALTVMDLELLPYNSQSYISQQAKSDPTQMQAYICNFGEHWLTVRKIGNQWFNLNSLLTGPELISDTYLSMFLHQLQQDGYSIFVITGNLTPCEADPLLHLCPAVQPIKPQLISDGQQGARGSRWSCAQGSGQGSSGVQRLDGLVQEEGGDEAEIQRALQESKKQVERDDLSLQRALQMSMEGYLEESVTRIETACVGDTNSEGGQSTASDSKSQGHTLGGATGHNDTVTSESQNEAKEKLDMDDVRQKRLAFLNRMQNNTNKNTNNSAQNEENQNDGSDGGKTNAVASAQVICENGVPEKQGEISEEEMLQCAIAMSMDQDT